MWPGASSRFRLFDGARTVEVRPADNQLGQMRDLFGRVIKIAGQVHYTPQGTISFMDEVHDVTEYTHRLEGAQTNERAFTFNRPLIFSADSSLDAKGFALHNDELDIHVFGNSLKEAFDSIGEHFDFLWDEYAKADESELHESALGLRAKLLEVVREVRQIDG